MKLYPSKKPTVKTRNKVALSSIIITASAYFGNYASTIINSPENDISTQTITNPDSYTEDIDYLLNDYSSACEKVLGKRHCIHEGDPGVTLDDIVSMHWRNTQRSYSEKEKRNAEIKKDREKRNEEIKKISYY